MRQCTRCGKFCEDRDTFCNNCGAPLARVAAAPPVSSKAEFLNLPENGKLRKEIRSNAIICYVCAGITVLLTVFLTKNYLSLLDVALLIGLGLGIHLKQSKVCAIILCAYAVINSVIGLITNGKLSGYLVLLAGIYSVASTFNLDKQWKQYQQQHGL